MASRYAGLGWRQDESKWGDVSESGSGVEGRGHCLESLLQETADEEIRRSWNRGFREYSDGQWQLAE
jgi:hypothetical protein